MSRPEYKHQCRYCAYCVYTIQDTYWCDLLDKSVTPTAKRPNRCAQFLFNEIPADNCTGEKTYKPRKPRLYKQMRLDFTEKGATA